MKFLAPALTLLAIFLAVGAYMMTNSMAYLSSKVELEDGRVILARDIKRNNIHLTSIWFRRHIEVVEVDRAQRQQERILVRLCAEDLSPKHQSYSPEIKLKTNGNLLISLRDLEDGSVARTMEIPVPDGI